MKRKIKIQTVSFWGMGFTIFIALFLVVVSVLGRKEFRIMKRATNQYIECKNSARQLQEASDYLTEQARKYASTGSRRYMDAYFQELNVLKRRDKAVADLEKYFKESEVLASLESSLESYDNLTKVEIYSMKLVASATNASRRSLPDEIEAETLSEADRQLSKSEKMDKAQKLLYARNYRNKKQQISNEVSDCMAALISQTKNRQSQATTVFYDMYKKMEIGIALLTVLAIAIGIMVHVLVVKPLLSYNESIKRGEIFPMIGAAELQKLAETYNQVYAENEEIQRLIRHQAEHDALTDLLNRGSYEKILDIYERGDNPFALILVDIDTFKSVNDTYGHAVGDEILKKVAKNLKTAFRSIDYVCRIGGDEFAVIIVEMTTDLKYTIEDKIKAVNEKLAIAEEGIPAVSLSVGVAFSDRENPEGTIFKDADKALYYVKENGRSGCHIF